MSSDLARDAFLMQQKIALEWLKESGNDDTRTLRGFCRQWIGELRVENERMREELRAQADLWDMAAPDLYAIDAQSGRVPFIPLHKPADRARKASESAKEKPC